MNSWQLEPGEYIVRKDLHARFGGQMQGGIATPKGSPNILLFADPHTGSQHGYVDEWINGELHYCGAGQEQGGDQKMVRGNLAILNHQSDGKSIRVFYGSRGEIQYAGEFELANDDSPSWYWHDVETQTGGRRKIIRFRLTPVGTSHHPEEAPQRPIFSQTTIWARPYQEAEHTPRESRQPFDVDPDAIDRGLAAHVKIQNDLAEMARLAGFEAFSPGPDGPQFDLAWSELDGWVTVVEVKSLTAENESGQIRLGLGQILDYAFQLNQMGHRVKPVLVVERAPISGHWVDVCATAGVRLLWGDRVQDLFNPQKQLGPSEAID